MIHPNKEAARLACLEYREAVNKLEERLGIRLDTDDSCVGIYINAYYLDENDQVKKFTLY